MLSDFDIGQCIESTYLSEVYEAVDKRTDKHVAVKKNRKNMKLPVADEIVKLDHPNLFLPKEVFTEDDRVIEVMAYCNWPSLYNYRISLHRIPFPSAVKILKQVAEGMAYMHGEGIIHHDLRDTNVLVHPDTLEAMIFDFNLSRKPYYMDEGFKTWNPVPAEYGKGKCQIDFQFDVYQFGYMCSGVTHHPVGKEWTSTPWDDVPPNFVDFTKKAMHKDRSVRHKHGSEVLDEFKALEKAL